MGVAHDGNAIPYCHPSWLMGKMADVTRDDEGLSLYDYQFETGPSDVRWVVLHLVIFAFSVVSG